VIVASKSAAGDGLRRAPGNRRGSGRSMGTNRTRNQVVGAVVAGVLGAVALSACGGGQAETVAPQVRTDSAHVVVSTTALQSDLRSALATLAGEVRQCEAEAHATYLAAWERTGNARVAMWYVASESTAKVPAAAAVVYHDAHLVKLDEKVVQDLSVPELKSDEKTVIVDRTELEERGDLSPAADHLVSEAGTAVAAAKHAAILSLGTAVDAVDWVAGLVTNAHWIVSQAKAGHLIP